MICLNNIFYLICHNKLVNKKIEFSMKFKKLLIDKSCEESEKTLYRCNMRYLYSDKC
jgi:hypothetical protein